MRAWWRWLREAGGIARGRVAPSAAAARHGAVVGAAVGGRGGYGARAEMARGGDDAEPSASTDSKLAPSKSVKFMSGDSSEMAYNNDALPPELQGALQAFDLDNSGTISLQELYSAANLYRQTREQKQRLLRVVGVLSVVVFLFLLANFGLTFAVVELVREVDTDTSGVQRVKGAVDNIVHTGAVDARLITGEADGSLAAQLVAETIECLLPVEGLPDAALGNPETALENGAADEWIFRFDADADADAAGLCAALAGYGGACTGGAEAAAASAATTGVAAATISKEGLGAFILAQRAASAGDCDAGASPFGLEAVASDSRVTAPAYHDHAHLIESHEHALSMHMRRLGEVHAQVASTSHGRRRRAALKRERSLAELPAEAKQALHAEVSKAQDAAKVRSEAKRDGDNGRALAQMSLEGGATECYFITDKAASYRGTHGTITKNGATYNCIDLENRAPALAFGGLELTSRGFPGAGLEDGPFCRNPGDLFGVGRPWCIIEVDGAVSAEICGDIPACEQSAYSTNGGPAWSKQEWAWALDRLDQPEGDITYDESTGSWKLPTDGTALTGAGVHAFIFDTGVLETHEEFTGRVGPGADCTSADIVTTQTDGNGHGTHVAGAVGGTTWGVAPGVTIHALKVLQDDGSGNTAMTARCVQYLIDNLEELTGGAPAVATMSLGSSYSETANGVVESLVDAGVFVAVAAGNADIDACTTTPASADAPMTVAAINVDDSKGLYSNWGGCVDIYAPGTGILSAYPLDAAKQPCDTCTEALGGTSMATPFVAGVAALVLEAYPDATPEEVKAYIDAAAQTGSVFGLNPAAWGGTGYEDEASNVEATANKILSVDADLWGAAKLALADQPAELAECGDDAYTQEDWDVSCPPIGSVVCGARTDEYHTDATGAPLLRPVRTGTLTCSPPLDPTTGEPTCVCAPTRPSMPVARSCAAAESDFVYLPSCGLPTGIINSTTSLEGKRLTFTPRPGGDTWSVTEQGLEFDGSAYVLPHTTYAQTGKNYAKKLRKGGAVKVSIPGGKFKSYQPGKKGKAGKVKSFKKFYVGAQGYVALGKSKKSLSPGLDTHFSKKRSAGFAISALYANLDVSMGGHVYVSKEGSKAFVTYSQVPAVSESKVSDYPGHNTFQVEFDLDTQAISVSYKSVVPLLSGRAVVGVALPKADPDAFLASSEFAQYDFEAAP